MKIHIPKRVLDKMTIDDLVLVGREPSNIRSLDYLSLNLVDMSRPELLGVRDILERCQSEGIRKLKPLISDIDRWMHIAAEGNVGHQRPKTLEEWADFATEYIRQSPGHRVYVQQKSGEWLAYYVNEITYHHERRDKDYRYEEAYVLIDMLYWELGTQYHYRKNITNRDVDYASVGQALAAIGLVLETDDLRADYLAAKERFDEVYECVGRQFTTSGFAEEVDDKWHSGRMAMMREGVPSKVVIDIINESGEERSRGRSQGHVRTNFWRMKEPKATQYRDSMDMGGNTRMERERVKENDLAPEPEIPFHPLVPIYNLNLHHRYKINVMELVDYEFNKTLSEQLVLPDITKNLIDVLVSQGKVSFQDIIEGKGAGACILLGGPPGVGKTLTAEVFAEATERPLLSVQAAQLGTSPDKIEENLRNVLRRGSRWNAVVLLDEADVYISERGSNLSQNAIVAAFLRILENHTATIFLTTNHLDKVDDAVCSRCLARIDYRLPTVENQRRIWQVLNELNGVGLSEADIEVIVDAYHDLSGRDIKQILKLASLWAASQNVAVCPEIISFVREFLPTNEER